jgi:hypothetical protein
MFLSSLLISIPIMDCQAQEITGPAAAMAKELIPYGLESPDGRIKSVFPLTPVKAAELEKKFGLYPAYEEGGIKYAVTRDWEVYAMVARESNDALKKALADLTTRVNKLEDRVEVLEKAKK